MSFKVELIAECVFETRDEAETYARDLASRRTLMAHLRVVQAADRDSHTVPEASPSTPRRAYPLTLTLGPMTRQYRAVCTTAPTVFDVGASIDLVTGPAGILEDLLEVNLTFATQKQMPARLILVEANVFDWQRARYASGLYASAEPPAHVFGPSEFAAELLRRLDRGTPSLL